MEQLLVIVFLGLLVGFGTARKRKNAGQAKAKPHPHPHIPVEDVFPLEQEFEEEPESTLYSDSATISDSVQGLGEPEYVFAGMEASQEEPTTCTEKCTEKEETDLPSLPSMAVPEFSLRDAIVNQTILERKYH